MVKIPVEISGRMRQRQRKMAVKNYLKGLTELLTNSHQSYRDMISKPEKALPIDIYVSKKERLFMVVDQAQGMDRDALQKIFSETGARHESHHTGSRSLFGKGTPDTLLSPITEEGEVHSIKNGKYNYLKFLKDPQGKEHIDLLPDGGPQLADETIRRALHVHGDHGTCVKWKLAEPKKGGAPFPRNDTLLSELKNFYMLRFINQDQDRVIKVHFLDEDTTHPIRFIYPDDSVQVGSELKKDMDFGEYFPIKITGKLFKTSKKLQLATSLEKRTGGLLIYDEEQNVIDLQLFGFTDDASLAGYYGFLQLDGANEVIRKHLDDEHEAIITETRDGFDQRSTFYKQLRENVEPWLRAIINAEEAKKDHEHKGLTKEAIEKQKSAFKELNKLYEEITAGPRLLDDSPGGEDGMKNPIEFAVKKAYVQVSKKYKVSLKVNTDVIGVGEKISLQCSDSRITFSPETVIVKKPVEGEVFKEFIVIESDKVNIDGIITAAYSDKIKGDLYVNVITEELHKPQGGIEFYPHKMVVPPGAKKSAFLYVDLTKVAINGIIQLNSEGQGIKLLRDTIDIRQSVKNIGNVAKFDVQIMGIKESSDNQLFAEIDKFKSDMEIEVREHVPKNKGIEIFNDWEYVPLTTKFQAYPQLASKKIQINSNHPINKAILGKDQATAEDRVNKFPHCQFLVGDLVLSMFLEFTFWEAYKSGAIDEPDFNVNDHIRKMKYEMGLKIMEQFVNLDEMRRLEGLGWLWHTDQ